MELLEQPQAAGVPGGGALAAPAAAAVGSSASAVRGPTRRGPAAWLRHAILRAQAVAEDKPSMEVLGEYEDEADDASDDEPGAAEPADSASFSTLPEHLLEKIFGHLRGSNRKHHFAMWVLSTGGPALVTRAGGARPPAPAPVRRDCCWPHTSRRKLAQSRASYAISMPQLVAALSPSVPLCHRLHCESSPDLPSLPAVLRPCRCGVNRQWRRLGQAMFFSRPWEVAHLICHPTQLFCLVSCTWPSWTAHACAVADWHNGCWFRQCTAQRASACPPAHPAPPAAPRPSAEPAQRHRLPVRPAEVLCAEGARPRWQALHIPHRQGRLAAAALPIPHGSQAREVFRQYLSCVGI